MWRAKMAGNWPNRPEKAAPMACNASSAMPSGMRTASVTNCAALSWLSWEIRMPWWLLTRPAFPSGATSQQAWRINIVAAPNRSRIGRRGVFLSSISNLGHTLLDRELYLPRRLSGRSRSLRKSRHRLPPSVSRRSVNWEDAMMERVHQAQIPVAWVGAFTVYGNHLDLRTWLEDHQYWFALAVASTEQIGMMTPQGRTLLTVAQAEQPFVNQQDWRRLACENWHKRTASFRVGVSAHFASKGAMTGNIGCSFVASQLIQQKRPITWYSVLLAPSFR